MGLGNSIKQGVERETVKYLVIFLILFGCGGEKHEENKKEEPAPQTQRPKPQESPSKPQDPIPLPSEIPCGDVAEVQQFMIFHNLKRCWHDAPRVTWNKDLAEASKVEALKCNFTKSSTSDSIAHGVGLGQIKAQDDWYMQFLGFPYGKEEYSDSVADFAHIVWQDSREIGCASVKCGEENVYYCKYFPEASADALNQVKFVQSDFYKCTGTN